MTAIGRGRKRWRRTGGWLLAALLATLAQPGFAQDPDTPPPSNSTGEAFDRLYGELMSARLRDEAIEGGRLAAQAVAMARQIYGPDHDRTLAALSVQAHMHRLGGHLEEARAIYEALVARPGRNEHDRLRDVLGLAQTLEAAGDTAGAELRFLEARAEHQRLYGAEDAQTLSMLHDYGDFLLRQSRFDEAREVRLDILVARQRTDGPDSPAATEDTLKVVDLELAAGDLDEAQAMLTALQSMLVRLRGIEDASVADALSDVAAILVRRGRLAQAEQFLRRMYDHSLSEHGLGNAVTLGYVTQLAGVMAERGNQADAEFFMFNALEIARIVYRRSRPEKLVGYLRRLANIYSQQSRHDEAEALLNSALALRDQPEGAEDFETISVWNDLAIVHAGQRRLDAAEAMFRRILAHSSVGYSAENEARLTVQRSLAELLRRMGRLDEAEPLARSTMEASIRRLGFTDARTLARAAVLADIQLDQGRFEEAEALLTRIDAANADLYDSDSLDQALIWRSLARARLARPATAAAAIEPARLLAENLRARRRSAFSDAYTEAQLSRERGQLSDAFTLVADALWSAVSPGTATAPQAAEEAFLAVQDEAGGHTERAIAEVAARMLAERSSAGLGETIRERTRLQREWSDANGAYSALAGSVSGPATSEREALYQRMRRTEQELRTIDERLGTAFPEALAILRPEALPIESVRNLLGPDEAMIVLSPGRRGTHIFALTHESAQWVRAESTEEAVNERVRSLLRDVGGGSGGGAPTADAFDRVGIFFDRQAAHSLYRDLVAPVRERLAGKRRLFVVASGALTSLPLGVLVTEPPAGADDDAEALAATSWLADELALVQLPTVQSLHFLRRYRAASPAPSGPPAFIGFGDPLLEGRAQRRGARGDAAAGAESSAALFGNARTRDGDAIADVARIRGMARLPGTAVELENLRSALGAPESALYLADRSTETNFKQADLTGLNVLALATHGVVAGEVSDMFEPGLIFTPPAQGSETEDGYLTASEVAALRIDADWVILSACNTAAGDGSEGATGLSGLARAFFFAGARNLLVSHWPVGDEVAARLTVRTVQILTSDPEASRAEALQRAMAEIRRERSSEGWLEWAHPIAWAPFTLIGDGAR